MNIKKLNQILTICLVMGSIQAWADSGTVEVKVASSTYTAWGTDLIGTVVGTGAGGITFGHSQVIKGSKCKTYIDYIKDNNLYSKASIRLTGIYGFVTTRSQVSWVKFGKVTKCELILSE